jgi:2-polyprenyl-3-methyl-5-hydroxy-6-metoxy-1,4-benzoquinol methylase
MKPNLKSYFSSSGTVSTWWRKEMWDPVLRLYFDKQLNYVSSLSEWKHKSVLDAGTGFGRIARALALLGARVHGVDISMDMIELARSNNEDLSESIISLQRGDIERLPFRNESFDAVVCMETLMHVPDPRTAIKELSRVARPGGIVILGINNKFSLPYLVHGIQIHGAIYRRIKHKLVIEYPHSIGQVRHWIKEAKLEVYDEIGIGLLHPETYFTPFPGINISLVPSALARWLLSLEVTHGLGRTRLKHVMKYIILAARKLV